uniref:DUF4806 domain-containing protein n=1 Tax=Cyprinus carpio carpio TaxID=630221 RepID=A0A9J7WUH0_CYPCA
MVNRLVPFNKIMSPSHTQPTSLRPSEWQSLHNSLHPRTSPQHAANRGSLFKPDLQTNMARGRMADTIPCSAAEVHILSLLETIKQQQDQLVAKVNYLSSRLNSTPGPDVEMPENIQFPLEQLEAVEAFEMFLKEPSNGPARQRVISSLATIGGQDVKRVTWNILGRLFTDEVSHQINWKGVNNKKPFSRMATKTLLFSAVRKNTVTRSATDAEVTKHAIRWFNLAADRATRRRVPPPSTQTE